MLNFHDLRFFPMFFPCLQMFSDFSRMFSPSFSMELPPFALKSGHVFQAPALPGASLHGLLRGQEQTPRPGAEGAQHGVQRGSLEAQGVGLVPWGPSFGRVKLRENHGKRCENHGTCVRGNGQKWRKNMEKQKESGWSLDSYNGNIMKYIGIMLMPQFRNAKLVICNSLYLDSGL